MTLREQIATLSGAVSTLAARIAELEAREARRGSRPSSYPRAGGLSPRDRQGAIPAGAQTDAYTPFG